MSVVLFRVFGMTTGAVIAGARGEADRVAGARGGGVVAGCERLAAELNSSGFTQAHERAYERRGVWLRPLAAAMGLLTVHGAAHELQALLNTIEEYTPPKGAGDERSRDQRHYDTLMHLMGVRDQGAGADRESGDGVGAGDADAADAADEAVGSSGGMGAPGEARKVGVTRAGHDGCRSSRYLVLVRVDASTLLGLDDKPGLVMGAGPVPAKIARSVARDATWRGLFTGKNGRPAWVSPKALVPGIVGEPVERKTGRDPSDEDVGPPRAGVADHLDDDWEYQRDSATGVTTISTPLGYTYRTQPDRLD
jgi:hypothetical protein